MEGNDGAVSNTLGRRAPSTDAKVPSRLQTFRKQRIPPPISVHLDLPISTVCLTWSSFVRSSNSNPDKCTLATVAAQSQQTPFFRSIGQPCNNPLFFGSSSPNFPLPFSPCITYGISRTVHLLCYNRAQLHSLDRNRSCKPWLHKLRPCWLPTGPTLTLWVRMALEACIPTRAIPLLTRDGVRRS